MQLDPLEGPAVWRGDELLQRQDWRQSLTAEELDEISVWLSCASQSDEPTELATSCPQFSRRLTSIQDSLVNGCGATLIRGLEIEDVEIDLLRQLFLGVAGLLGTPLSQSADGDLIFSVQNAGFADDDPRARGPNTRKKLSFHTDRCDVIGFLCVRQAKSGGENQLVSSAALFNEIRVRRPDLLSVLTQPYCYQRHNVDTGNDTPFTRQPIFAFRDGFFHANFLRVLIDRAHANPDLPAMTEAQREALDFLEQVAAEPAMHVTFRQQPGDIVFMNNWLTLHRRTEFEDQEDPRLRRHILRVWLSMPNSRAIDPLFAGNYGATEAGAIRGGMRARD